MTALLNGVYVIAFVTFLIYLALRFRYHFWERRGIPYLRPVFPFGVRMKRDGKRRHFTEIFDEVYYKFKNSTPFAGIFLFFMPVFIPIDLDLVQRILVQDFNVFHDRGVFYNEKDDPLSAHLFSIRGKQWKNLRAKLSPTFTSGKMKFMFSTISKVANELKQNIDDNLRTENVLELKDLLARFTTDIIGTCAFGIECNSLKNPDAEFLKYGRLSLIPNHLRTLNRMLVTISPSFAIKCGVKSLRNDVSSFFLKVVKETVELREKSNIQRNDFMDLLIQLKNEDDAKSELGKLTLEQIAAQAFLFFLAGFETSSTTMSFCLYELATNVDIQDRARQEIVDVLERHNGEFTYEAMMEMPYLDCVINETLRKHPPVVTLIRIADEDYTIPNTNKILNKGSRVFIPVYSIHHDPEIYPNPDVFDPNRFSLVEKKNRHPISFLGFGDGPRSCIGLRFGLMETRIGLVTLLRNFRFKVCSKTMIPMKYSVTNPILSPEGGIWLEVEKIE